MVDDFEDFSKGQKTLFLKHLWNKNFPYVHSISLRTRFCWPNLAGNSVICILFLDFVRFASGKWTGIRAWWTKSRAVIGYQSGQDGSISRDAWLADFVFRETWNVNVGNYSSWLVTRSFCETLEEHELFTDIRDFTTLSYVILRPNTSGSRVTKRPISHSRFCFLNTLLLV